MTKRETTTLVMGSDTALVVGDIVTVTVRVVDTSPGESSMPTGNVTVTVDPTGQGTPTSWLHTLVAADAGQFTFTYSPSSAATTPHTFTATYAGDSTHNGSSGSFAQAIFKRAADVRVLLNPTTAYIGQPVTVAVRVEDDTTVGTSSIPTGTITFDDGGKNGVFSSNTASLSGGICSVTYTPGAWDAGVTVIAATYSGSNVHATAAQGTNVQVLLRPTETTIQGSGQMLLVNQSANYTATVTDIAGVGTAPAPAGTLAYSAYLGVDASISPTDTSAPDGSFTYRCLGLDGHAGIDTLYANYTANDGIHANSAGYYGQGIQRRPTITTLSNCTSTPAGVTCVATVAEDPGNAGTPSNIQGNLVRLDTGAQLCAGLSGPSPSCTFSMASTLPLVNVAVRYVPTDRVHLESTASQNVNRFDQFPPDPGDGSTGADCTDGCGSGGVNVAQMIFDLNAAEIGLKTVKWGLDITALVLDVIPDGVITGGIVVQTGVTILYSDIAMAIVAGAGIALDIAIEAMDTDLDDDGIPDVLENSVAGTDYRKWDTDGDGLGDLDEIEAAGGYYGGSRRPNPNIADSDGDGLSDGDEDGLYRTNFCVVDTDCDTVGDGVEVNTWSNADLGNHADPLMQDTDGDGLRDDLEITAGCPFVNDDDSDNDGLSDWEEVNVTGTDPLDADTDNDTLADADELVAVSGTWPNRQFDQVSDPLSTNTDGDHLFDPQEFAGSGLRALAGGLGGTRDLTCPYVNDADSDDDGIQDSAVVSRTFTAVGVTYSWTHHEDFGDIAGASVPWPGTVRTVVTVAGGEQNDDTVCNVCDADSDGDGLLDGEEIGIGTDPGDWDTDDDGRNDWHEVTGGGPIPTDPFDPDTDDDGLLDSTEVFGSNPTNPANCDTDGDGLCDGGSRTPYMTSGHPSVLANPRCVTGIGGHPNPIGIGENERGDDARHSDETDPNNPDTDGDAVGDGIERLSFSVSRQHLIPATDLFGRPITVVYPEANNVKPICGCMDPLNPDSDGDGLLDGEEDLNHDGHFDFLLSDFDHSHHGPIPGPAIPHRMETNPCDPDTDHDGLTDWEELRGQANPPAFLPFNPTNPLDHDTDNDWLFDGEEVSWVCTELTVMSLDNDGDGLIDEDPVDGLDNDGDGLIDEDDVDFCVRYVPMLDPTNRDSNSDGFIDGLDPNPCNSQPIPIVVPVVRTPVDTDGDGFADEDERAAGTDPRDLDSFPQAFTADLDLDGVDDDRLWLSDATGDGMANTVTIDIDSNILIDIRVQILAPRDMQHGDFDGDGGADDCRSTVTYAFANRRVLQPRITLVIYDYNCDLVIDRVEAAK